MNNIDKLIADARGKKASDIHLSAGCLPFYRIHGQIETSGYALDGESTEDLITSFLDEKQKQALAEDRDVDFCYTLSSGARQRVNIYRQKNRLCATIRMLNDTIPDIDEMGLPQVFKKLALLPRGLVLVTGATGSGKSTTLAAMIDYVNRRQQSHIITIEDPTEYVHTHKKSIVHQREVPTDVPSFSYALRSALREDPDVILVGEMRDLETISAAITAAETGHLVMSTLHTSGAASTIDRIIDVFPAASQGQIRAQLAVTLKAVISQQLLRRVDGAGRVAAFEILIGNDAVANMIREGKGHQVASIMQTGLKDGMQTLDFHLARLVGSGMITQEDALEKCSNRELLMDFIRDGI